MLKSFIMGSNPKFWEDDDFKKHHMPANNVVQAIIVAVMIFFSGIRSNTAKFLIRMIWNAFHPARTFSDWGPSIS